jgi:uncharacterized protein YndB with AHSA1/START domain
MDAWLDPDKVRTCFGGAVGRMGLTGEGARAEVDPRVGGKFLFADVRDGVEACHWGTYLEMERPKKMAFTWNTDESDESDPIRIDMTFEPEGEGCVVRLVTEMDEKWTSHIPLTTSGWSRMLEATEALLDE